MSPELKLYYKQINISVIAKGAGVTRSAMASRLSYERKLSNLKPRDRNGEAWRTDELIEFINDRQMVSELYKAGITISDIASKWGIERQAASKYMRKWGVVVDELMETITLAGLYTGWADVMPGKELLLTINKKPMFKLVRVL